MDYNLTYQIVFQKNVIEKYNIKEELTPVNLGDGELDKVILSDLRKALDFCFIDIKTYAFKEMLIDYIEDYLIDLRFFTKSQKKKFKNLNKQIKFSLNENEIDELIFKSEQEEIILIYLQEQKHLIRNWVSQKRIEYNNLPEKELKSKERERESIKKLIAKVTKDKLVNKYDKVFLNAQSYHIFNDYINSIKKNHLTEFSFIYRIMVKQGLIDNKMKVNIYKKWLNDEFEQDFTTIKQLNTMSLTHRLEKYNTLKELYKPFESLK